MGAIGGLLGTAGGANGTGFAGPSTGNIVTPGQLTAANNYTTNALGQQQAFTNAVSANGTAGLAAQGQVLQQLQQGAAGQGPNPALAQLNQTTGQNVANQSALMAGQRGASQNAGLIARQAAQQGASTQQQAAGQAATQQAQQQIAYQQALAGQANAQVGQQASAIGAQTQAGENQQNYLTSAAAGLQSNVNNVNGQLANTTMQGQQAVIGGLLQGASGASSAGSGILSSAEGGLVGYDDGGAVGGEDTVSSIVPGTVNSSTPAFGSDAGAAALSKGVSGVSGGGSGGGGSGGGGGGLGGLMSLAALAANGGKAQNGGLSSPNDIQASSTPNSTPVAKSTGNSKQASSQQDTPSYGNSGANALYKGVSSFGQYIANNMNKTSPSQSMSQQTEPLAGGPEDQGNPDSDSNTMMAAEGGKVPAMVSPGEIRIHAKDVPKVARGEKSPLEGEKIAPGVKPKVGGAKNSYANDIIPKDLNEGDIILPRSVTKAKNPQWAAHAFVSKIIAQNGRGLPKK